MNSPEDSFTPSLLALVLGSGQILLNLGGYPAQPLGARIPLYAPHICRLIPTYVTPSAIALSIQPHSPNQLCLLPGDLTSPPPLLGNLRHICAPHTITGPQQQCCAAPSLDPKQLSLPAKPGSTDAIMQCAQSQALIPLALHTQPHTSSHRLSPASSPYSQPTLHTIPKTYCSTPHLTAIYLQTSSHTAQPCVSSHSCTDLIHFSTSGDPA